MPMPQIKQAKYPVFTPLNSGKAGPRKMRIQRSEFLFLFFLLYTKASHLPTVAGLLIFELVFVFDAFPPFAAPRSDRNQNFPRF